MFALWGLDKYYILNNFLLNVIICKKSIKARINDYSILTLKYILFNLNVIPWLRYGCWKSTF